ncbi:3-oxoacyl-[acyl-carrier-protein] reductase [Wickerhamomyces ciferrii]|uniref:3-oxoacyl-[acyl-carrier-protein] reductase n=1 Tax=Wickerhamomyces ciferrii (strain ATCC 14091 / BCRC 22168 / CBS 111 / JCM 3599 / NBRC 0793 / NRRL Y-1031 F-60-10) TaxID=1206466 RepID=K0KI28_WICCF|nr:3-oxoacyl-[acyl-carrier-protein] reductase [Wickerhamomyces ciferrii]CCH41064.1 3-oxoacyl-[acyl-carrier-protein] reductase [Wickerhamomyces ciferrii]
MTTSKPKSVFITGASAGIGYALSIEFAKRGYKVFAGARNVKKLENLKQYGITIYEFDITKTESIFKVKDFISKETGGELDILYNNVGISPNKSSILDQDIKELRQTFDANYFGHIEVIQAFQQLFLKSRGLIAFTDSVIDLVPTPFLGGYAASKAAFHQLGANLALEVNSLGVKVVQVRTGNVSSELGTTDPCKTSKDSVYYLNDDVDILKADFGTGQDSKIYAKNVINDIEKVFNSQNTYHKIIYRGESASTAYWMNWLVPFWAWSYFIIKFLKIDGLFAKVKQKIEKQKTP